MAEHRSSAEESNYPLDRKHRLNQQARHSLHSQHFFHSPVYYRFARSSPFPFPDLVKKPDIKNLTQNQSGDKDKAAHDHNLENQNGFPVIVDQQNLYVMVKVNNTEKYYPLDKNLLPSLLELVREIAHLNNRDSKKTKKKKVKKRKKAPKASQRHDKTKSKIQDLDEAAEDQQEEEEEDDDEKEIGVASGIDTTRLSSIMLCSATLLYIRFGFIYVSKQ